MLKDLASKFKDDPIQLYTINESIAQQYATLQFDSLIKYLRYNIDIAEELGDIGRINSSNISLALKYGTAGYYNEALDILNHKLDTTRLDTELKSLYNFTLYRIYDQLASYSPEESYLREYLHKREVYGKRVTHPELLPQFLAAEFRLSYELNYISWESAKSYALELTQRHSEQEHTYALAAYFVALISRLQGNEQENLEWLMRSAITDIRLGIRDNTALHEVANDLLEANDIERAMAYIRVVLDDAKYFNSRLRQWQDAKVGSEIEQAYNEYATELSMMRNITTTIIALFVVLATLVAIKISRQASKLKSAKAKLEVANNDIKLNNEALKHTNEELKSISAKIQESNTVKEEYIGTFMAICSQYIDRIISNRKHISKLVRDGNLTELKREYITDKVSDNSEIENFYRLFDEVFLNLYPTFVTELNSLLGDHAKLEPKGEGSLNTELRIFAMIRLGITDLQKISTLLRYSMSTIYNYRSKIKNGATCNKEEFEMRIRTIGTFNIPE